MSALGTLRRWYAVLANPPQFATSEQAFAFLAAADARRASGGFLAPAGCECKGIAHALTLRDQMSVTTALQVAKDQGQPELADYLTSRLGRCSTFNPTPEQAAERDAADLRNARKELDR